MATFLVKSTSGSLMASIQLVEEKEELRFHDDLFKRDLDINGITMSQKVRGVWRVFPDKNPDLFLWAIKYDQGFLRNYEWISQEEYTARQDPNYYAKLANRIIELHTGEQRINMLTRQMEML